MPEAKPLVDASKTEGSRANAEIHDRTGLYISIIALGLAGVSLGMQLRNDAVIDAKVAAAVAPANERVRTASTDAKLAEDRANKMAAMLEAKGLIKLENH